MPSMSQQKDSRVVGALGRASLQSGEGGGESLRLSPPEPGEEFHFLKSVFQGGGLAPPGVSSAGVGRAGGQ